MSLEHSLQRFLGTDEGQLAVSPFTVDSADLRPVLERRIQAAHAAGYRAGLVEQTPTPKPERTKPKVKTVVVEKIVEKVVEKVITAPAKPVWLSVEKTVPETGRLVIVLNSDGSQDAAYLDKDDEWNCLLGSDDDVNVTHWTTPPPKP